ncbi:hypothetical protein CEXT_264911 [Caerostris extrusa]|uniref:Uncharacterized protein n=1 Tax=Caerostris extrusa TaxID=172846 RepID=A0AAV4WW65_CAEEX|nr:hypothetical protein CEXT_264911 [Caerostris extrusa]
MSEFFNLFIQLKGIEAEAFFPFLTSCDCNCVATFLLKYSKGVSELNCRRYCFEKVFPQRESFGVYPSFKIPRRLALGRVVVRKEMNENELRGFKTENQKTDSKTELKE